MYSLNALSKYLAVSKSQIALMRRADPEFPKPVYLTPRLPRLPRWREVDVENYLKKKEVPYETI